MNVRQLINGQTVQLDNHNRGSELIYERGLHLHKRMNKGVMGSAEVIVPLSEDGEIEFRSLRGNDKIKARIRNEIKKAFKDKHIRINFVKSFYKSMDIILSNSKIEDFNTKIDNLKKASLRMASCFGLTPKIVNYFMEEANTFYAEFVTKDGFNGYMKSDVQNETITIGTDLEEIKDFK